MKLAVEGIPIYPRTVTIVNEELGKDFMSVMGEKNACLLLGHGLTTAGGSVEESTSISLNVFELARLNYMAYAIGTPKPIPERDITEYQERWARGARRRLQGPSTTGEPSFWRYYRKLLQK
jgi:ribulose-5-phosphate 4-epimerase/fuculose-1-phosphate aldolase